MILYFTIRTKKPKEKRTMGENGESLQTNLRIDTHRKKNILPDRVTFKKRKSSPSQSPVETLSARRSIDITEGDVCSPL